MKYQFENRWHVVKQAMNRAAAGAVVLAMTSALMLGVTGCAQSSSASEPSSQQVTYSLSSEAASTEDGETSGEASDGASPATASEPASTSASTASTPAASTESGASAQSADSAGQDGIDESLYKLEYSDRDKDPSYDKSSAETIELTGASASSSSDDVKVDGSTVTITAEGVYVISGTLDDGQVVVDAPEDAKVQLVLDGANVSNSSGSAIYVAAADKCFITLADGSENKVSDGSASTAEGTEDAPDAAIYAECDLTLQGSGVLTVIGNYNDGVKTKDDLVVTGGTISITAKGDGMVGKDSVKVLDGTINVKADEGDGIKSTKSDDETKGFVVIDGGTVVLDAGDKGVKAETYLRVSDGAALNVTAVDDALHSDGNIRIDGGEIELAAGDDGVHAEYVLEVNGGTIDVKKCVEGLEGQVVTINDGKTSIVASDDGVNAATPDANTESGAAATGSESFEAASAGMPPSSEESKPDFGGRPDKQDMGLTEGQAGEGAQPQDAMAGKGGFGGHGGFGTMMDSDESCVININGGTLVVEAEGDGIDSNGYINMNGGEVYVSGPTSSGNGSLDYGIGATVTGGTLIAAGSAGMAATFTDGTQAFALVNVSGQAGDVISVSDAEGNELASFSAAKDYQCVVVTAPGMQDGQSYTLEANGVATTFAATTEGDAQGFGGMGGQGGFGGPGQDGDFNQRPERDEGQNPGQAFGGQRPERPGHRQQA